MGNKLDVDLNSQLEGKQINTEELKEIYKKYAPKNDIKRSISKPVAMSFIQELFKIYQISATIYKNYKKVDLPMTIIEELFGPNKKIYFHQFKEAFLTVISYNDRSPMESSLSQTLAFGINLIMKKREDIDISFVLEEQEVNEETIKNLYTKFAIKGDINIPINENILEKFLVALFELIKYKEHDKFVKGILSKVRGEEENKYGFHHFRESFLHFVNLIRKELFFKVKIEIDFSYSIQVACMVLRTDTEEKKILLNRLKIKQNNRSRNRIHFLGLEDKDQFILPSIKATRMYIIKQILTNFSARETLRTSLVRMVGSFKR
eukprot:TRINITY_DN3940_c0_g1_i1.p1 TRINITY_DN3940_c0_g1~~TRINITY_DN3940_c0_g1_i1.p1  ORF type:complete len:320 (+),score=71.44 TRINITY_DN3940_c0_g1_i1:513-1472(+)